MADLYDSLPLQRSRDIRLLHLNPAEDGKSLAARLEVVSLDSKPTYIALSYAWGELVFDAELVCDGHTLKITSTLYTALSRMRQTNQQAFWVDQVCINQPNLHERSHQVSIMRQIYRSAENVFIWLGPHDKDTEEGFRFAERLAANEPWSSFVANTNSKAFPEWPRHHHRIKRGFYKLYARPWFTRCWVIQEAAASPHAIVFCGEYQCAWRDIAAAAVRDQDNSPEKYRAGLGAGKQSRASYQGQFSCMTIAFLFGGLKEYVLAPITAELNTARYLRLFDRSADPLAVMSAGDEFEASNPRDRVYAMLGLIDERNFGVVPDYALSTRDVYVQFSRRCILSDFCMRFISTVTGTAIRLTVGLPSWCMDFGPGRNDPIPFNELAKGQGRSFVTASALPNNVSVLTAPQDSISLLGAYVDTITALGPVHEKADPWELKVIKWVQESKNLVHQEAAASAPDTVNDEQFKDDMMRKLTRLLIADNPTHQDAYAIFSKYWQLLAELQEEIDAIRASSENEPPHLYAQLIEKMPWRNDAYFLDLHRTTWRRRVCITSQSLKSLIGLVHGSTKVGDQIWILPGAGVPVILRPYQSTRDAPEYCMSPKVFELVTDAFVLDIMEGEALRQEWFNPEEIILR